MPDDGSSFADLPAARLQRFRIFADTYVMSSVTSLNQGVTDLFQALSNTGSSSLSSVLSSPALQSALKTASPGDIVKLSEAALQLQSVGGLFGGSNPAPTSATDPGSQLIQALDSSIAGSTTSSAAPWSTPSTTNPANAGAAVALQQISDLFGAISPNTQTGQQTNSLNFLG